ncbi:MAG: iron-sulfur cluster assembly scaffold protein [Patescibacteria group bacterium]|jgi:NifU-like protein involved in Fe-S cluster formation/bacterioferritin-associated ferredoxin
MTKPTTNSPDITPRKNSDGGFYSDVVKDHFFHPKNFMEDESAYKADGQGVVGSPACGDVMRVWIKVDPKTERVTDCRWKTFGCASAIAATSMMSTMVIENNGMTLDQARQIRPQDIMERLGGLPARKIHCSVLGDKALRSAINDYYRKSGQIDKIEIEQGRVIDKVLKITDHDIEEAVLEGADTLDKIQSKTKVGTGDPSCIPEVEQLMKFYKEKYFG